MIAERPLKFAHKVVVLRAVGNEEISHGLTQRHSYDGNSNPATGSRTTASNQIARVRSIRNVAQRKQSEMLPAVAPQPAAP
jgi:hypothetical protein